MRANARRPARELVEGSVIARFDGPATVLSSGPSGDRWGLTIRTDIGTVETVRCWPDEMVPLAVRNVSGSVLDQPDDRLR